MLIDHLNTKPNRFPPKSFPELAWLLYSVLLIRVHCLLWQEMPLQIPLSARTTWSLPVRPLQLTGSTWMTNMWRRTSWLRAYSCLGKRPTRMELHSSRCHYYHIEWRPICNSEGFFQGGIGSRAIISVTEGEFSGSINVGRIGDNPPRKLNIVPIKGGVTLLVELTTNFLQGKKSM